MALRQADWRNALLFQEVRTSAGWMRPTTLGGASASLSPTRDMSRSSRRMSTTTGAARDPVTLTHVSHLSGPSGACCGHIKLKVPRLHPSQDSAWVGWVCECGLKGEVGTREGNLGVRAEMGLKAIGTAGGDVNRGDPGMEPWDTERGRGRARPPTSSPPKAGV